MNKEDVMKLIEKFSQEGSTTTNKTSKNTRPKRQFNSSRFTKKTTTQPLTTTKHAQPYTRRKPPIKSNQISVTNKQRFSAPKEENELEKNPRFQTQKSKYSYPPKKKVTVVKEITPKEDENKEKNQQQKKIEELTQKKLEELTQKNKKLENEIQQLEEKQNQLGVNTKQTINHLENEKKNLEKENQKNKNDYEDLLKKNKEVMGEFEKTKKDFEKETEKTNKLQLEIESKNEKILELETKLKKENEQEKKQKVNHQEEKAEEEKDQEKYKIKYSKLKNQIENLDDQINSIKLENKELKSKNEDLMKDNNKIKQHLEQEKEENGKLIDKIKSNESESNISTNKIEQERLKYEEQIRNLKQTITLINKDNEKLNKDLKDNKNNENEKYNSLIQLNEYLEKQNKTLDNKNNSLKKKIQTLTNDNDLLQDQVLTLEENLNKAEQREVELEKNHLKEIKKILNLNQEQQKLKIKNQETKEIKETDEIKENDKEKETEETEETKEVKEIKETEKKEETKEQNEEMQQKETNEENKTKEKIKSEPKKRKTKKIIQTNNLINDDQIEDKNQVKTKTKTKNQKKEKKNKHLANSGQQSKNQGIQLPITKRDLVDSPDTTKMPIYIKKTNGKSNLIKNKYELDTQSKKSPKGKRNKREKELEKDPHTEIIKLCILLSSENLKTDRTVLLNAIEFARFEINKLNQKLLLKISCIIYDPEKEQSEENEDDEPKTKKTKQNTRLKFYYREKNKNFLLNKLKNKKLKDEAKYPNLLEALQVIRKTKWKSKHNLIIHWFNKKFFKMNGLLIDDDYLTLLTRLKKQNIFYYAIGMNLKTEKKKINSFKSFYKSKKKNYLFQKISRKSEKKRFEWDGFLANFIINAISKNNPNNKLIELMPQLSNKERRKWNNATDVTAFYSIINENTFRTIYNQFNSNDNYSDNDDYEQTPLVQKNKIHIELISKQSKIKISKEPFLIADTYKFYYLKDVNIPTLLVAKAFKTSEFNTEISQYLKLLKTISYTLLFAKIFNNHECVKKKITFWGKLLYSKQKNEDDFEYFFVEPFLQNYNLINVTDKEELNTIQAFRHFSYQFSNQKILIGKCNKIGYKYICPRIHSQRMIFGYDDGGYSQLLDFKEQHICNHLCKKLGLAQLRK